jgi:4-oxalocrotonate tautomerase
MPTHSHLAARRKARRLPGGDCDDLYRAMRETLKVPENNQSMTISEHDGANFRYGGAFDMARSDDLVLSQVTVFKTRTVEQKKALFRRTTELLRESTFE